MKKRETVFYNQYLSIYPTYSCSYVRAINPQGTTRIKIKNDIKRTDNRKRKRLLHALQYLLITSPNQNVYCKRTKRHYKFRLNFITLTLASAQIHSDNYVKEHLLKPFLKWLLRQGAKGYVWKAEKQKNGNIHFHITTNKYIHYMDIRNKWNGIQENHGYINYFFISHGDYDPNSTDVKAVKNEEKALEYMLKYIAKNQKDRVAVEGKDFGYSDNLCNIKPRLDLSIDGHREIADYIDSLKVSSVAYDFVTVIKHKFIDLDKCPPLLRDMILNS